MKKKFEKYLWEKVVNECFEKYFEQKLSTQIVGKAGNKSYDKLFTKIVHKKYWQNF